MFIFNISMCTEVTQKVMPHHFFSPRVTELESCFLRYYTFELPSFCVLICKGSRRVTPLLQLFKMESTSDSCYKQHAVIEFLVAVIETVGNIP